MGNLFTTPKTATNLFLSIGSHKTPDKITKGLVGLVKEKSKISIVDKASNLDYTDKNGNKLIPQGLESNNLFLVEIDTKP